MARRKIPITYEASLRFEPHRLHVLYCQTQQKLQTYWNRVQECKDVQQASEFARWLETSGIVRLLTDNPQGEPLPVDGAAVHRKIQDLLFLCSEKWKGGAVKVVELSEVEKLSQKIDSLADTVDRLKGTKTVEIYSEPILPLPRLLANGGKRG